ncbi:nuclear transport factor 2 family protein [Tropicimonas marinistellae]|uniref:nuclear transport factor 2 family protein n=1 Tax=Tropicimonas marinistellae TaxID=1739787 RepID=UPI0013727DC7|nr:nuclear transport factor 2 family protein [Tropicimonas marinistellae]
MLRLSMGQPLPRERQMAILDKMNMALAKNDADAYLDLYADDAVFVRYRSDTTMDTSQFAEVIRKMMASAKTAMGARREICENDDILVVHGINGYVDGTRQAVLMALSVEDGQISRVETGHSKANRDT